MARHSDCCSSSVAATPKLDPGALSQYDNDTDDNYNFLTTQTKHAGDTNAFGLASLQATTHANLLSITEQLKHAPGTADDILPSISGSKDAYSVIMREARS